MPAGDALPHDVHPYLTMMVVGFVVGALGHLVRSRWLVALGVVMIFTATLLMPLALNLTDQSPPAPSGPVPSP